MIIESLLDTDLYKFTMQQCVLHQFPGADAEYRFKCRTPGIDLSPFVDEINAELDHLCSLYFREDELAYLDSLRFIKSDYVEFLSLFHLKRKYISVTKSQDYPCGIDITAKGPWLHTILFEIPVLATRSTSGTRIQILTRRRGSHALSARSSFCATSPTTAGCGSPTTVRGAASPRPGRRRFSST